MTSATSDSPEFHGKRVVVTGGTEGIGRAIVERVLSGGANVLTTARRATSKEWASGVHFVSADLTTPEGCQGVIDKTLSRMGGVDILANVVGGSSAPGGGFSVLTDEEWVKALNLNLFPAIRLDRGLLPSMLKLGSGVIIHISSIQVRLSG